MGPTVGVAETSHAWCPLKCHAYLRKPDGARLFECAWPFDEHYQLIIHYCVVSIEMPCILTQNCCYRFCLSKHHLVDTMHYNFILQCNDQWDGINI